MTSGIALLILMTPFPDEKNEVARGEAMNRFLMQFKTDYPEIQNLSPNFMVRVTWIIFDPTNESKSDLYT